MHAALSLSAGAAGTSGRQQPDRHLPRQPALTNMQQQRLTAPAAAPAVAGAAPRLQRRWVAARAVAAADGVSAQAADEWVEVGRVGPPHGVRGEMKVQPLTDFPEDRLGEPGARWVPGQGGGTSWLCLQLAHCWLAVQHRQVLACVWERLMPLLLPHAKLPLIALPPPPQVAASAGAQDWPAAGCASRGG
jgi:hypothetical protein